MIRNECINILYTYNVSGHHSSTITSHTNKVFEKVFFFILSIAKNIKIIHVCLLFSASFSSKF